jgi:hypothetical protein
MRQWFESAMKKQPKSRQCLKFSICAFGEEVTADEIHWKCFEQKKMQLIPAVELPYEATFFTIKPSSGTPIFIRSFRVLTYMLNGVLISDSGHQEEQDR